MLLGWPFEVLLKTGIQNFENGDQMITIWDPNSKLVATVPTILHPPPMFKSEVFHLCLMN